MTEDTDPAVVCAAPPQAKAANSTAANSTASLSSTSCCNEREWFDGGENYITSHRGDCDNAAFARQWHTCSEWEFREANCTVASREKAKLCTSPSPLPVTRDVFSAPLFLTYIYTSFTDITVRMRFLAQNILFLYCTIASIRHCHHHHNYHPTSYY